LKYRPEIDGLRALAVVPVILFHAGFELFSGGFVGVDVFFVISGYLITTILIEDIENKRFSLVNFYERRARRILPALFFVMLLCIPFAWIWMMPRQMDEFSQSLIAVSLFSSNILFKQESGYFATASEEKPLLHTWSLAVEEQYYVLFPIFLILFWRFGKNRVFWMIVLIAAISLLMSEWGWRNKSTANFYLAPTRAWELLAGSVAAFIAQKNGVQKNNFLALLGLMAIIVSIFVYDESTPFPSLYALVPVIGVMLFILYATKESLAAKILSTKAFVGIGLVSYSAYLWHQPIFAFAKIKGFTSDYIHISLFIITFALAYFSWKIIEQPFRSHIAIPKKLILAFSLIGFSFFLFSGYLGHKNNGFPQRLEKAQVVFLDYFENSLPSWNYFEKTGIMKKYWDECNFYDINSHRLKNSTRKPISISPKCTLNISNKEVLFIWGDSHAQQFSYGIREKLNHRFAINQIASSGCTPQIVYENSDVDYCLKSNYSALAHIRKTSPSIVLLAQNADHDIVTYKELINEINRHGTSKILVMGPSPHWEIDLPELLARNLANVPKRLNKHRTNATIKINNDFIDYFTNYKNVIFVDVIGEFCDKSGCLTHLGDNIKETITSWDYGHLTPVASLKIVNTLISLLKI
tara:strand:+ start:280 stop:2190 length:1911 start_codon:yes stop_codon:yes gene_type:complete